MKKCLMVLTILWFVGCTKPVTVSPLCGFATVGVNMVAGAIVDQLKTCSGPKLANKVLELAKCPVVETRDAKSFDWGMLKVICPFVVNAVVGLSNSELTSLDCNAAVVANKISQVCSLIK